MISVKLYFIDEIRRFQFDAPKTGPIYSALVQKIRSMYSDFQLQDVNLCWKDSEGDMIVFTTDDELREAMLHVTDSVFRVTVKSKLAATPKKSGKGKGAFVKASPRSVVEREQAHEQRESSQPPAGDDNDRIHKSVTCDSCEQDVRGIRYKCMMCPDYDLCSKCEGDKKHDQHPMMRITDPDDNSWKKAWSWRGPRGHRFHRGGPPPAWNPMNIMNGDWTPGAGMGPTGFMPPFMGLGRRGGRHHGPYGHGPHHCKKPKHSDMDKKQDSSDDEMAGQNPESEIKSGADYLRQAGEFVQTMLGDYGIDVDFSVDHPATDGAEANVTPHYTEPEAPKETETKTETKPEVPVIPMEPVVAPEMEQKKVKIAPIDFAARRAELMDSSSGEENAIEDKPAGWTIVNNEIPPSAPDPEIPDIAAAAPAPVPSLYPSTSDVAAPSELDDNISKALHHMLNMGFSNDGNWLGQLLEAKKGNISAVLDALAPVHSAQR